MRKLIGGFGLLVGLAVTLGAGWLLVRGPFFGGPMLDQSTMLAAVGALILGVIVSGWGAVRFVGIGARL
jgi:hypothetical protein